MYYYELHSHTVAASLCSVVEPEDYIDFYIDKGYSGMVITDHFYYGNTSVDRRLPWDEFIDLYSEGYRRAKAAGDARGFSVFFGFEQKFADGHDEYLVLGISPAWLKVHPEIRDMDRLTFFDTVHRAGGFIIQAHPFRSCYYISSITLSLDYVDAVEVVNLGHDDAYSRQAYEYAKNLGLPMTGGSDIHSLNGRKKVSGVALEKKVGTVEELIEEIREGRAIPAPIQRFEKIKKLPLNREIELDVYALSDIGLTLTDDYFAENKR
ncbi:MAG: PHP-associated domain-containing protein [Eubacteriales bacterium]